MSSFIGPALPPHLLREVESGESHVISKSNESQMGQERESDTVIGPSLPPGVTQRVDCHSVPDLTEEGTVQAPEIGPSLLSHVRAQCSDAVSSAESAGASICPALPPHLKEGPKMRNLEPQSSHMTSILPLSKETDENIDNSVPIRDADEEASSTDPQDEMYGPALPPGLRVDLNRASKVLTARGILGPHLPPGMKFEESVDDGNSDSESDVGPMPAPEGTSSSTYCQEQFDDRALRMKRKLVGEGKSHGSGTMKRESWMLELPPDREADFGLGPRQFRARTKPELGDRSVWTDTPADRLQKKLSPGDKSSAVDDLEKTAIEERDKVMQHLVEKHSGKKRQESLLEAHQKELKRKKKKEKEEGKSEERRPFDRNIDLQANRFDEGQKKAIFKKAQLLDDRFSSGRSKFL